MGFYHIDVPTPDECNRLNFKNCGVLNILKGDLEKAMVRELMNVALCKQQQRPWQIRELIGKTLLVVFPPWKNVEDLIKLQAFDLKSGINVKITSKGSVDQFGETVEAGLSIEGLLAKWCTWKVFAKVASCFGINSDRCGFAWRCRRIAGSTWRLLQPLCMRSRSKSSCLFSLY